MLLKTLPYFALHVKNLQQLFCRGSGTCRVHKQGHVVLEGQRMHLSLGAFLALDILGVPKEDFS